VKIGKHPHFTISNDGLLIAVLSINDSASELMSLCESGHQQAEDAIGSVVTTTGGNIQRTSHQSILWFALLWVAESLRGSVAAVER
jgi:hypothetical protein